MVKHGRPSEFFQLAWTPEVADSMGVKIGLPAHQTCFEFAALYLTLRLWADGYTSKGLAILGDNVSSLACAVSFRGRGSLTRISREIAWRKVRRAWRFKVAHVPSERNETADSLSRTAAPTSSEHKAFPAAALRGATRRDTPPVSDWWRASR